MFGNLITSAQVASLLRTLLQVGSTALVTRGVIDSDTATSVVSAIVLLATTAWGLYARRATGLVASAANVPGVSVSAPASIANAVTNPKVTSTGA